MHYSKGLIKVILCVAIEKCQYNANIGLCSDALKFTDNRISALFKKKTLQKQKKRFCKIREIFCFFLDTKKEQFSLIVSIANLIIDCYRTKKLGYVIQPSFSFKCPYFLLSSAVCYKCECKHTCDTSYCCWFWYCCLNCCRDTSVSTFFAKQA